MVEQDSQGFTETSSVTPPPERKVFGSHLPPPTRTIALGDKLPPARRAASGSGSSSESEEEDDTKFKVELLPDASRASRRPPIVDCHNYSEFDIHVQAYSGVVAVSGHTVAVASGHHLRVYDLSISASPTWHLDSKDGFGTKLKDFKVMAMEFRPTLQHEDRGHFLWIGTKDGHLIELDVRTGTVTAMRPAIHVHVVTHMFRHGQSMVSMDNTGKVLIFTAPEGTDLSLATLQPRVVRIAEKQEFTKLLGSQLWTSTRDPNGGGSVPGASRGPYVRVYDIFTPGAVGRSLLPTEHLGAVAAGTVLASHPGHVFLAHEGGNISIWSTGDADGAPPQCVEVVKVSTSDVLSLEGVNERLWAGSRKGLISAYDITTKPWTVTNCWAAHKELPVLRLAVDTWSMEKLDRLVVYSVGRDEQLKFWDGMLGVDWIEQELLKHETEFSAFRDMTVLIVSWNVDSAKPDQLTGTAETVNFLTDVLQSVDSPDVIVFGMQELIDLESRKMAAKTVLLGGKSKSTDGALSQKVSTAYRKWHDRLVTAVRCAMPIDSPYTVTHTENLVGLFTCIFVKNAERIRLKHTALTTVKRGMGGRYGNKGAIIGRFVVDDTSVCFINCHLAAGQHHVRQRNRDIQDIVEDDTLHAQPDELIAYINGGDGSMVLDHEIVFMNGDMNYRIDQRREAVVASINAGDLEHLVIHDQLRKEMKFNRAFRARTFSEGPLNFVPTYKYDRRSDEWDSSEKARAPAWCDRVLWRSLVPERVTQLHYRRWEPNVSDHRPISSAFRITVKQVNHEARAKVKARAQERWKAVERERLSGALQHYIDQMMI
ncbi:DNase I-like protein [Trametes gibbosa]|nr:DNase I-like protein [Trametes gibbosa]